MKNCKTYILTLLAIFTGTSAFGQARRGAIGKTRKITTVARPSTKMINGYNEVFKNRYFFNYEANNSECDVVFKQANTIGNGSGLIVTPSSGQSQSFSYNITANGSIYIKINSLNMKKEKITWHTNPEGFFLENMFFQLQSDSQKYNELINWEKNRNVETATSQNSYVPSKSNTTSHSSAISSSNNDNKVFDVVDEMPSFPGGWASLNAFLANNLKYPVVAQENNVQGRVNVGFVVERDGSISDIKVMCSVDPSLDREAQRVIKAMPKWKPGKLKGETVRVKFTVPVVFRLQ